MLVTGNIPHQPFSQYTNPVYNVFLLYSPSSGFSTVCYQVGGYAAYANASDEVLMRCDQSLSDLREVVPTSDGIEYPSLQEVSCFFFSCLLWLTFLSIDH